jgi:lipoate-protein ligase B
MADRPGGASGLLVRDSKKDADRLVKRIDPGVVSLLAELRAHERQAAEKLGQWKTNREKRKVIRPGLGVRVATKAPE